MTTEEYFANKQASKIKSIANLARRHLASFIDHEAEAQNDHPDADPLCRLSLNALRQEPLAMLYVPDVKLPDLVSGLAANGGQQKVWTKLREAVKEAETAYGAASNKTLPCLVIPDGPARLVLVTSKDLAEDIIDMPLSRLNLGGTILRVFLVSEYARARAEGRVPHVFG